MTDILLFLILAVLVVQNLPRIWGWLKPNVRQWQKNRRRRRWDSKSR